MRPKLRAHAYEVLVVALYVAAQVAAIADPVDEGSRVAQVLLPAAWTLPLLARRRAPAVAALVPLATLAVESQLAQPATESITVLPPVMIAFWVAGTVDDRAIAVVVGLTGGLLAGLLVAANPGPFGIDDAFFVAIFASTSFLAGFISHTREQRARSLEQRAATLERDRETAVADERARIARELHDVVGHAISLMTVQTGAARVSLESDPARARESLLVVEATGRQALAEMRRMLAVLRDPSTPDETSPQPGLGGLEQLVDASREAGLDVDVEVDGAERELPPGVDLAAYRILQEALTNVRKHGAEPHARVGVRYGKDMVELTVENDGPPIVPTEPGHGHVGMRERVALYGGELVIGPRDEGGYVVLARLPLDPRPA